MKAKVSVTLDDELVAFIDSQPGSTRSAKIESALRRYRHAWHDAKLREELGAYGTADGEDDAETRGWRDIMQETMWKESAAVTSGPSRSRRSRSRARR